MTALTPAMDAALAADRIIAVLMVEALLPGGALRLMFGTGAVAWGAKTFRDTDATYGTIAAVDAIEDGAGDEASPWSFTMLPHSDAVAAALANPALQGSDVYVWLGALSPVTMQLLPDPVLLRYLQWDVATLSPDRSSREVEVECADAFALLLEDDEGSRLTDAHHQSIWPGEKGLANVTGLTETRYWGMATPRAGGTVNVSGLGGFSGLAYQIAYQ